MTYVMQLEINFHCPRHIYCKSIDMYAFCFGLLITVPVMKSELGNRIVKYNVCVREILTNNFMEILCFGIVLYDFCTLLSHTSKNLTKPAFSLLILAIGA